MSECLVKTHASGAHTLSLGMNGLEEREKGVTGRAYALHCTTPPWIMNLRAVGRRKKGFCKVKQ